jgi:hypothetical protein
LSMFSAGLLINPNMPRLQFPRHHLSAIPLANGLRLTCGRPRPLPHIRFLTVAPAPAGARALAVRAPARSNRVLGGGSLTTSRVKRC